MASRQRRRHRGEILFLWFRSILACIGSSAVGVTKGSCIGALWRLLRRSLAVASEVRVGHLLRSKYGGPVVWDLEAFLDGVGGDGRIWG